MFESIKRYIFVWTAIAVLFGLFCGYEYLVRVERKIGYDQAVAEYTARALIAEKAARVRESELTQQLEKAQNAATIRDQQIQTLSAAVNAASGRLRDSTIAIRNSLPKASSDAVLKAADTTLALFSDCQRKYIELGKIADGHASDVETLMEAWPHEPDEKFYFRRTDSISLRRETAFR